MENEEIQNEINIIKKSNIFQKDYENQNVSSNAKYQKWKESMLKEYNDEIMIFECVKDKILFCTSYKKGLSKPSFRENCPICKKDICYFCSNSSDKTYADVFCCYKIGIYYFIYYKGFQYIKDVDNSGQIRDFSDIDYKIILPGINIIYLYITIFFDLFLQFATKESLTSWNNKLYPLYDSYESICGMKRRIYKIIFIVAIPYFIHNILFIIILFIISIPFKFYPLKYYYGIVNRY